MKYRKKPIVIEAMQFYFGEKPWPLGVSEGHCDKHDYYMCPKCREVYITTPEGVMTVSDGDWVIKGIRGEFYPCKPDIFDATYELVED